MISTRRIPTRRTLLLVATFALLGACDDGGGPAGPTPQPGDEHAVVLNSLALTLSVYPTATRGPVRTVELGPEGSPASMAVRGGTAVVPMGVVASAAVVDLVSGTVLRSIPLPDGSGATGVAIVDDTLALVANPELNTVTPVLYHEGTALGEIAVPDYPGLVVAAGDVVVVASAHLDDDSYAPTRTGTLTFLDARTLAVIETIDLSGLNPGAALVLDDRLYVLHSGRFGQETGSLSVVDLDARRELLHVEGMGEFPGGLAALDDGTLLVASLFYGLAAWSPASGFVIRPGAAPAPDEANVIAIGVDEEGTVHALDVVDYEQPGRVLFLDRDLEPQDDVRVGTVPLAIRFTRF